MYIYWHHWMNLHTNRTTQLFPAHGWDMGISDCFETNGSLSDSSWCPVSFGFLLRSIAIESPSKHKASTLLSNLSPLVPHFLQPCFFKDCSIFSSFLELKGQNTETSLHSGSNANNSFHFPRDGKSATLQGEGTLQYQGKHGSLESNLSRRTKSSFMVSSLL